MRLFPFLVVLLVACSPTKRAATVPQPSDQEVLLSQALNATVALVNEGRIYCSGSFVLNGHVLTAQHCVDDKETVQVQTYSGAVFQYRVVKRDEVQDLALMSPQEVVKVTHTFPVSQAAPRMGQQVVLIGHPFGAAWSLFVGRVNNPMQKGFIVDGDDVWMMSDVSGGPGASGGPVLNEYGELVGVNIWSPSRGDWRAAVHHSQVVNFLGEN